MFWNNLIKFKPNSFLVYFTYMLQSVKVMLMMMMQENALTG